MAEPSSYWVLTHVTQIPSDHGRSTLYQAHACTFLSLLFLSLLRLTNICAQGVEISLRVTSALVDIVIATSMVYLLASRRHTDATFDQSRKIIFRLIVMTVSTGFWTAVVSLIDLGFVRPLLCLSALLYLIEPTSSS